MLTVEVKGDFSKTRRFFKNALNNRILNSLDAYGRSGVVALSSATPVATGITAQSWSYTIVAQNGSYRINWFNSHRQDGVSVAILLQYGHGTRNGGYVQGRDYINPALRPIFDKIANDAWKAVTTG